MIESRQNMLSFFIKKLKDIKYEKENTSKVVIVDPVNNEIMKKNNLKDKSIMKFTNEYDATVGPKDMPIHYSYFSKLRPVIPANEEINVARYCYDAGNVNMYQTTQIMEYFGVKNLPCVIVDGKVLSNVSAKNIIDAMK